MKSWEDDYTAVYPDWSHDFIQLCSSSQLTSPVQHTLLSW